MASEQSQRIGNIETAIENLKLEQAGAAGETTKTGLTARKEGLEAGAEQAKKDQEELARLNAELAKAQEERLTGLEKIDAEETAEIDCLNEIGEANKANLLVVSQIYDDKRLATYSEEMDKYDKLLKDAGEQWDRLGGKAFKVAAAFDSDAIKAGKEKLEEYSKALAKVTEPLAKLIAEQDKLAVEHQARMIALAPGAAANPVRTLQLQQAPERAAIEAQYREQLTLLRQRLALAQADQNTEAAVAVILENQRLRAERKLALDRLDYELAEKQAEVKQKGIKDIFLEAQGSAQSLGNIFYQGMNSAMDRASDQLAKFFTGQKTSVGKMLQGIGEEIKRSAIRSGIQRGVGALGKALGIQMPEAKPDGTKAKPYHVIVDNAAGAGGGTGAAGLPEPPAAGLGGIVKSAGVGIAGLLSKIFGNGAGASAGGFTAPNWSVSMIPAMAEGGPVSAGSAYLVGDAGIELYADFGIHHAEFGVAEDDGGRGRPHVQHHGGCAGGGNRGRASGQEDGGPGTPLGSGNGCTCKS